MPYDSERAAGFIAAFESDCAACPERILEGDDASWLDGEAVHAECAEGNGVEVYWP